MCTIQVYKSTSLQYKYTSSQVYNTNIKVFKITIQVYKPRSLQYKYISLEVYNTSIQV